MAEDKPGFIEEVLKDTEKNKTFYKDLIKALRQTNYDTKIQDKEIDLIRQMYSPAGLVIQERVSAASGATPITGAKLPPEAKNGWRRPLAGGAVTSEFGYRIHPIDGTRKLHTGIDIGIANGTPVFAAKDGKVITASWQGRYGKFVIIDHGGGVVSRYGHNSALFVQVGQQVKQGSQISATGSTGASTGGHLHFEIQFNGEFRNPREFVTF